MKKNLKNNKPANWDAEISELEQFFDEVDLPKGTVINKWTKTTDVRKFIDLHLAVAKAQRGNPTFLPYLNRLQKLKKILTQNKAL